MSLFSLYLFNDYQEQVVITRLKEDKAKFEILISSVFISPILEEVFFRFIVYTEFKKKMGIFFGVLFSSLLFSIVHYNIYSFAVIFIVGLICALQFEKTGDIKNSIIIHSLFNLVMVILTLLS
jgi:membrane protease YdiL (CAAX protease family)